MDDLACAESEARFAAYVAGVSEVIGHADRVRPLEDYCRGLLLPGDRKSVEPMAAVTAPSRVAAQHQSLLHFVANSAWSDERVLAKVRELVLPSLTREEAVQAWIVDDTGIRKKGRDSVGVARQYCGEIGARANCQVAVMLSLVNHSGSLPVAYRLYLPEDWATDMDRRAKAGVPETIRFQTKPALGLEAIRLALAAGLPRGVVVIDAGYGNDTALRGEIGALDLCYVAAIQPQTAVWKPGSGPLPPKPWSGRGGRAKRVRRTAEHRPISVKALALGLPGSAFTTIAWREGSAEMLSSRFARFRLRPAHDDHLRTEPYPEEWLLIEWPEAEAEPTSYWFSNLAEDTTLERLVDLAKLRWRVERDYQELKQELGLDHYEGRGWRGFHHHATLCIAAYAFLIAERAAIPPCGPPPARWRAQPELSRGHRPRGAANPPRTAQSQLDRNHAPTPHCRPRQELATMPLLRHAPNSLPQIPKPEGRPCLGPFMTQ